MPAIIHPEDLFILKAKYWPDVYFYDQQVRTIESWCYNDETYVPAAQKMGKDFVAGFINLGSFLICQAKGRTCRLVTTSVAEDHLDLLWGEIGRFVTTATCPLLHSQGGPLVVNNLEIRRIEEMDAKNPLNYLKGIVAEVPEKMQGHHAEFTGFTGDEASALRDDFYRAAQGWAKRMLFIGNPLPCANFFKAHSEAGDVFAA